jgi:hypothetical protein
MDELMAEMTEKMREGGQEKLLQQMRDEMTEEGEMEGEREGEREETGERDKEEEKVEDKENANDYSRFDDINDMSDDESSDKADKDKPEKEKISLPDALSRANGYKDAGNSAFKRNDFAEAKKRYEEGIEVLVDHKDVAESKVLLVSLHGNGAMVLIKLEDYMKAAVRLGPVIRLGSELGLQLMTNGLSSC